MYEKTAGLQATIRYLDGYGVQLLEKLVTNPQAGDRAQAAVFGAQIFAGDGSQTIIPWGNVIGAIKTEFVDVYLKMDQESEQYVLCPLDEVDTAAEAVAAALEAEEQGEGDPVDRFPGNFKDRAGVERGPDLKPVQFETPTLEVIQDDTVADIGGEG